MRLSTLDLRSICHEASHRLHEEAAAHAAEQGKQFAVRTGLRAGAAVGESAL